MRTTISIDDTVADLAAKIAEREKRNFSNLCEVALAEYCEAHSAGLPDELMAATAAATQIAGRDRVLAALQAVKAEAYSTATPDA